MENINAMKMTVTLTRREVNDLCIICIEHMYSENGGKKWAKLYEKLRKQRDDFDRTIITE